MPEGDTLRRAAEVLTPVLEGQVVTDLWFQKLRGYRPRVGDTIHSVEAVGKYLLIEFDRKLVLHTHLGVVAHEWARQASPAEPEAADRDRDTTGARTVLCCTRHLDPHRRVGHSASRSTRPRCKQR